MNHAVLLAGDLDFRPIVDAVVRAGIFVEVWNEKRSAAKELAWAADGTLPIDWYSLYHWGDPSFQAAHTFPTASGAHAPVIGAQLLNSAMVDGCQISVMRVQSRGPAILKAEMKDGIRWFEHEDQRVLERFFSMMHGPVDWQK